MSRVVECKQNLKVRSKSEVVLDRKVSNGSNATVATTAVSINNYSNVTVTPRMSENKIKQNSVLTSNIKNKMLNPNIKISKKPTEISTPKKPL